MNSSVFKLFNLILLITFFSSSSSIFAQTQTAQSSFEQGMNLVREQKFNEALAAFQKSAQLDAKNPSTQANIGLSLIKLNRALEAVAPFREAVRLAPSEASFHIGLCQSLSLSKNHTEAILHCEEAVKLGGANVSETHVALAAALRTANRRDDALRVIDLALTKFAENEILLNSAAEIQTETGNFAGATEIYEKLSRLKPSTVLYQVRLAENYLRLERDGEAVGAARKALAIQEHPLAYFFLGKIYFELGQNDEAADAFQRAAALDSKLADAFYFLGLSHSRRGKLENAIAALRQAVALAPENFDYNKELGSALTQAAQYEEAIKPLKKAVALKPNDFEATVGLGLALFESTHYDQGLAVLNEADRMKPGNSVVNMFLSVSRARQQGLAQVESMKVYSKENPQDIKVRVQLIQVLGYAGRLSEAEPYIKEISQLSPNDVDVNLAIATVYTTVGNFDKASEIYRKTLVIKENPGAYLGLANFYNRRGQIEEASKAYDKVLELKPDSPNIMKIYADFLRNNGKRREALEMYKRSLAMLPTNAPALFNAGILSVKFADLVAAQQYLATLKAVDPQSAKILARFLKSVK